MRHVRGALAIALILAVTKAIPSSADTCSLNPTVSDAKVAISLANSQTSFLEGETIPITLSFTSTAEKRYWADNRNYDRSGRLELEAYCLEPATRDPAADYFRAGTFMGGGLGSEQQLSEKPFIANAELNEWRQPAPGHYKLYVVSHRVWRPPDPNEATPYGRVGVVLRSNTIEFDVIKADSDWAAEQLGDATTAYQNGTAEQQTKAARRLRFLNTRQSAELLTKLFWGLNDQPGGWDLMFGLFGSPYRTQVIAAMEREIKDPSHPITQDYLHALTKMQIEEDAVWNPPTYDPAHPEIAQEYWRKRQDHERTLMQAAVEATTAALPQKTGRARAVTLQALAEAADLLGGATASQVRKQFLESWNELPEKTKSDLIQYRWSMIAGPEMLPILKDFVSGPAPRFRTTDAGARDAALQHIFDLSPDEGRALILRDLRDPRAQPSISLVKLLSADELSPIVKEAVARIEKSDARELDYHLVELYGDRSLLSAVERVFQNQVGRWACDPQSAMLRYFLRLDPEFGTKMVQASLASRKVTGCYRLLFQDLGKSLPKIEPLATSALDDADSEVANDAALALGRWGSAKAEAALWARLKRFHQQWKDHEGELRYTPDYQTPVARATVLEATLVNSIATGTNWISGPEKFERLSALASPRQQMQISTWKKEWERGEALILPNWYPENNLSFGMLQYSNLDEQQFRAKLSQMPAGIRLYFQIYKPGQISPWVSMEKQEEVLQELRDYAARFGLTIEEKSEP
jgi:hypothetical protein